MQRLALLDWARGVAVILMIFSHCFNSMTRLDVRKEHPYMLVQMAGGMASVIFLFLAGITFAFGMASADKRALGARHRFMNALRRAGFVIGFAHLFRGVNWIADSPFSNWVSLFRVDILNTMGASMLFLAPVALLSVRRRIGVAVLSGLAIAFIMPWMSTFDWQSAPVLARDYLMPRRGGFPLFPYFSYLAFGVAAGALFKGIQAVAWEKMMLVTGATGVALLVTGQFISGIEPSWFGAKDYWADDPVLVGVRLGVVLLLLPFAWLWTSYTGSRWSWVQTIGKESLLIYWVHIAIVYGKPMRYWRRTMVLSDALLFTLALIAAMVALAQARLWWKERRRPALHIAQTAT